MALLPVANVGAQDASAETARTRSSTHCGFRNHAVRTLGGGGLGAWLGFMVNKIKVSDWSDGARGAPAIRRRNQAIAVGAVAGMVIGNLPFWSRCGERSLEPPRLDARVTAPSRQVNRPITAEEITSSGITGSVYDLVYSLRRNWLNVRGANTFAEGASGEPEIPVYLDNTRIGTVSDLRELPILGVTVVRYYDASQATFRWGGGHAHGAIEVLTVIDGTP